MPIRLLSFSKLRNNNNKKNRLWLELTNSFYGKIKFLAFFIFPHLLNLPYTSTNISKTKLSKSSQPFSSFSERQKSQLIVIHKKTFPGSLKGYVFQGTSNGKHIFALLKYKLHFKNIILIIGNKKQTKNPYPKFLLLR